MFALIVPAGSGAADEEVASMDEEEDHPEQVEDVEGSQSIDSTGQLEVLIGVAMFVMGRRAHRVVT